MSNLFTRHCPVCGVENFQSTCEFCGENLQLMKCCGFCGEPTDGRFQLVFAQQQCESCDGKGGAVIPRQRLRTEKRRCECFHSLELCHRCGDTFSDLIPVTREPEGRKKWLGILLIIGVLLAGMVSLPLLGRGGDLFFLMSLAGGLAGGFWYERTDTRFRHQGPPVELFERKICQTTFEELLPQMREHGLLLLDETGRYPGATRMINEAAREEPRAVMF